MTPPQHIAACARVPQQRTGSILLPCVPAWLRVRVDYLDNPFPLESCVPIAHQHTLRLCLWNNSKDFRSKFCLDQDPHALCLSRRSNIPGPLPIFDSCSMICLTRYVRYLGHPALAYYMDASTGKQDILTLMTKPPFFSSVTPNSPLDLTPFVTSAILVRNVVSHQDGILTRWYGSGLSCAWIWRLRARSETAIQFLGYICRSGICNL